MLIKSFGRHFVVRIAFITAIQACFIVAKLTGLLTWHWLLIFAPMLITGTVLAIVLCIAAFFILLSGN